MSKFFEEPPIAFKAIIDKLKILASTHREDLKSNRHVVYGTNDKGYDIRPAKETATFDDYEERKFVDGIKCRCTRTIRFAWAHHEFDQFKIEFITTTHPIRPYRYPEHLFNRSSPILKQTIDVTYRNVSTARIAEYIMNFLVKAEVPPYDPD